MPSPSPERDPTLYLQDMAEFCDRVSVYVAGHDARALLADRMRYDAILRNLELIGEAATRVPVEIRDGAPEIAWRLVIGTRDRPAHGYLGIEPETVWMMATQSVPNLRRQLDAPLSASS